MKKCIYCSRTLPLSEYYKARTKDGLAGCCKACHSDRCKKRYLLHQEQVKKKAKKWYIDNRESVLSRIKSSYDYNRKSEYDKVYKKKYEVVVRNLYLWIKYRTKNDIGYRDRKLLFTIDEFLVKAQKSRRLRRIYNVWVKSNFDPKYRPTVDRINNNGDYTMANIQFLTSSENSRKGTKSNKCFEKDKI